MSQNRKAGDWDCPKCNDHQFARNSNCRKCGTSKPGNDQGAPPARFYREFKRGDWSCPVCGDHQFARNTTCRRCGSSKNVGELSPEELRAMWRDFMDQYPKRYCDNCQANLEHVSERKTSD